MERHLRATRAALGLVAALAAAGCAMTPDEIRAVEVENALLREQIQALREKCQQGREIELRPEPAGDE